MSNPLTDFINEYAASGAVSFHTPGHKGARFFRRTLIREAIGEADAASVLGNAGTSCLAAAADRDITEIPGSGNLFAREGIISDVAEMYRKQSGSRASYLLVNGSTAGIQAALYSVLSPGDTVIVSPMPHRSVMNGIRLAGAKAVVMGNGKAYDSCIDLPVDPDFTACVTARDIEEMMDKYPAARAVLITHPNYYGVMSELAGIAEVVHARGLRLICDQAHGAHLAYFDRFVREPEGMPPASAARCGADIVIESTHKTLASFTQSAVAHIFGDRVSTQAFEEALALFESSSPSYILMESLALNAEIMEKCGEQLIKEWHENILWLRKEMAAVPDVRICLNDMVTDETKILMSMDGMDGIQLQQALIARGIWPELATDRAVLFVTGIGNERSDYEKLVSVLKNIAAAQ
ncbi:MAG: aminotransferase class V-fold PLP-dependent enzyme [Eubacterium sp.]|nr:aminotransferase class V-fold PLP-dependent enzyme [Eubacterium sp.]